MFSHAIKHVNDSGTGGKPYDAEVEYIESTGTQYIDTGIVPTQTTKIKFAYLLTQAPTDSFAAAFGCMGATGGASSSENTYSGFALFNNPAVPVQARVGKNTAANIVSDISVAANVRYEGEVQFGRMQLNGTEYTQSGSGSWITMIRSICTHTANDDSSTFNRRFVQARFFSFSIYDGSTLVRDFIPVRVGTEYCLYDKANQTGGDNGDGLYHNKGTGAFKGSVDKPSAGTKFLVSRVMGNVVGTIKPVRKHYDIVISYTIHEGNGNTPTMVNANFPSGKYTALDYTPVWEHHRFAGWSTKPPYDAEVEYLESTGAQWIDTGVAVSDPSTVAIEIDEDICQPLGFTHQNVVSGTWLARYAPPTVAGSLYIYYKNYSNRYIETATETRKTSVYDGSSGYYENGTQIASFVASVGSDSISNKNWFYGACYDFNTNSVDLRNARAGKIYSLKIHVSGVLVRYFVPVRVGTVGYLYDKVSGTLFGNAGTGAFVLGPDVSVVTGKQITPATSVIYGINDVYATWQSPTTVTFDATTNGGTMPSGWTSPDYYEGQPYGTLPEPTKSGEVFLGWFTSGGTRVTESSTVTTGTLTARYAAVTYDTSFQVTTTSSYRKTGIYSATSRNSSNPTVIDWGDGNTDVVYGNISQLTHTYSSNGTFTVQVNNNISNIALSTNNSTWYDTTSQNRHTVKKLTALGANITALPSAAFMYCSAMTDALLPSNALFKTIPQNCFAYCSVLKPVAIPSKVTTITDRAFQYITGSQFSSVTIPATVTYIGQYAFYNCNYLKNIIFGASSTTLTLGTYAFAYCFYQASAAGTIDLSARKITSIPNYCFYYCRYLKGITWPQGLTSIGGSAFRYCFYYSASTGTIEIPEGVTSISGTYAFANCLYLTAVTLPSTLTNLNNYTFYYCTRLATITSNRSTAPTVSSATFGNGTSYYTGRTSYSAGTNRLYVPAGATGYDSGYWRDPLCSSTRCGFTLVQAVSITFDVSTGGGTMPSNWTAPNYWPGLTYGTLPVPEKSGATFDGWFLNGTQVTESSIVPSGGATLVAQFSAERVQKLRLYYDNNPYFSVLVDYPLAEGSLVSGWVNDRNTTRSGVLLSNLYRVEDGNGNYVGEIANGTVGQTISSRWYDGTSQAVFPGFCEIVDLTPGQKRVLDITYNGDTARVEIDWDSKSISVISPGSSDLSGIYVIASQPTTGGYEFDMYVSGNPNDGPTGPMLMIFAYDNLYNKEFFNHYSPVVVGTGVTWAEVTA